MGLSCSFKHAALIIMLFSLKNVYKCRSRDDHYRLYIRNLQVCEGSCLAITGPSGCGKSTALDLLGMTLKPDSAEQFLFSPEGEAEDILVRWEGLEQDFMASLRRRFIAYVLQTGELLPFFTVYENIALTAALARIADKDVSESIFSFMEQLQIRHLAKAMPATLSVGERQRVAICRALVSKPRVILADEPTAALDPVLSRMVMRLFMDTVSSTGVSLVMVSHDIKLVREFAFTEVSIDVRHSDDGVVATLDDSVRGVR